ncbi:phosphonate transport system permease protein [Kineosphaera limosa]|uniref:Phosphonate ABC transporter permease protein n=1 Tax=Kineosphaera limosa NBRC 100340 TaxID=1184609 RepID=K6W4M5_9MICO|nr:phosphonate ABC transporter, permease protein PhnE [Kineosphaera limosa]NYE02255.1 phosphonate transport system permease protein [Kineosphaera limosa]GAB94110.1 phosphonate ABC transporter permease protein [Kineosphaera limosa NBRC 100340]
MPVSTPSAPQKSASTAELPAAPPPSARTIAAAVILLALLAAAIWSIIDLRINIASLADSASNAVDFAERVFPLDFPPLGELLGLVATTLAIVTLATALSVVLSLPVAIFAASNTTTGRMSRGTARVLIVVARAIPDLILAIIFFRIFGLGALPGILALGIHSVGMVAKLYADAIESLDNGPLEAIRAAGGSRLQQITVGIIPPLMPQLIATALHRFDINLRTSVVLGYVGVGGLGLEMADAMRTLNYPRGMALALFVLVLCIVVELLSGAIRSAIMAGATTRRSGGLAGALDRISSGWFTGGRRAQTTRPTGPGALVPPWTAERVRRFAFVAAIAIVLALAFLGSGLTWRDTFTGLAQVGPTVGLFFPPGGVDLLTMLLRELLITVEIALAATLLGAILALPIGILAARNVVSNRAVQTTFRVLIVLVRGIPELILAIIFVVVTGLGSVAGTLALAIGAIGLLSKLVADSLEETDTRVQDALRASGATGPQVFVAATLRQAAPAFVAHLMYLLDVNVRSATLLGIVGAGGIGFYLLNASRVMQFDVVTTIVLMILAVVLIIEGLAIFVRKALS